MRSASLFNFATLAPSPSPQPNTNPYERYQAYIAAGSASSCTPSVVGNLRKLIASCLRTCCVEREREREIVTLLTVRVRAVERGRDLALSDVLSPEEEAGAERLRVL